MIPSMKKNGLLLALFGIACAGVVALTYEGTKSQIAEQQRRQLMNTLHQIIPADRYDNELYNQCLLLSSPQYLGSKAPQPAFLATKNGEPTAIAIETTAPDGYNGDINIIVGIDWNGEVLGVRTLSHQETPGLGDLIELRRSDWVLSFNGYRLENEKDPRWAVKRDGGEFDQFTGATITPRAYVGAVRKVLNYFNRNRDTLVNAPRCGGES
ncbi:electron transport complex subunit RsxG [Ferrimonas balearica]|uniref:electron transport complex subunit RsxG n=1 Tax=Ferrimonas balearica TaxID=44012 RepID=UPI001C99AA3E|nr:electron transport complex subunit RsxG [Ferrimonas balearica]MBY5920082.1 electron transport complex subunit RsxG [Ferrimonas balearica]MBY5997233.1 electron transport complex subunit RsxG [Ferrimonas balearica]